MTHFTRLAYLTMARDTGFVALAACLTMVAFSFELSITAAFKAGASVVLLFSIVLMARAGRLTEERFLRCDPWLSLRADERPADQRSRTLARAKLEEMQLRVAKYAAAAASLLYGSGLLLSMP